MANQDNDDLNLAMDSSSVQEPGDKDFDQDLSQDSPSNSKSSSSPLKNLVSNSNQQSSQNMSAQRPQKAQSGPSTNNRVYGTQQAGRPLEASQRVPNALQYVGGQAASRIPRADEQADGRTVVNHAPGPANGSGSSAKKVTASHSTNAAGRSTGGVLSKLKTGVKKVLGQTPDRQDQKQKQSQDTLNL